MHGLSECGPGKVLTALNRRIERKPGAQDARARRQRRIADAGAGKPAGACLRNDARRTKSLSSPARPAASVVRSRIELGRRGARSWARRRPAAGAQAIDAYLEGGRLAGRGRARRGRRRIGRGVLQGGRSGRGHAVDPRQQCRRHPRQPADADEGRGLAGRARHRSELVYRTCKASCAA